MHCPFDGFFIQWVKEPVIQQSHMYLLIHWLVNQEYIGEITFQWSFVHTCYFPVTWACPNVNQHFSSKSRTECLSVCPVLFWFQHPSCCFIFWKLCLVTFLQLLLSCHRLVSFGRCSMPGSPMARLLGLPWRCQDYITWEAISFERPSRTWRTKHSWCTYVQLKLMWTLFETYRSLFAASSTHCWIMTPVTSAQTQKIKLSISNTYQ